MLCSIIMQEHEHYTFQYYTVHHKLQLPCIGCQSHSPYSTSTLPQLHNQLPPVSLTSIAVPVNPALPCIQKQSLSAHFPAQLKPLAPQIPETKLKSPAAQILTAEVKPPVVTHTHAFYALPLPTVLLSHSHTHLFHCHVSLACCRKPKLCYHMGPTAYNSSIYNTLLCPHL